MIPVERASLSEPRNKEMEVFFVCSLVLWCHCLLSITLQLLFTITSLLRNNLQKGFVYAWLFCCVRCRLTGAHTHISRYPRPSHNFWDIETVHVWAEVLITCGVTGDIFLLRRPVVWFWALCIWVLMAPCWSTVRELQNGTLGFVTGQGI